MRVRLFILLALLCGSPAWAQNPPEPPEAAPAANPGTNPSSRVRLSVEQRFQAANVTQDGKLTREQARQGYKSIARNFDAIDATGKGFVTLEDIRTWRRSVRDGRQAERATMDDPLRPRQAIQRRPIEQPQPISGTRTADAQSDSGPNPELGDDRR